MTAKKISINQCAKCVNETKKQGRHCVLFVKEPAGCLVFNPIRPIPVKKNIIPSWFGICSPLTFFSIFVGVFLIKEEKQIDKDKL